MKISKQEKIVHTFIFDGIKCYVITRNILGKYTLYKIIESDYQKLKSAETPIGFEEIIEKDRSK